MMAKKVKKVIKNVMKYGIELLNHTYMNTLHSLKFLQMRFKSVIFDSIFFS